MMWEKIGKKIKLASVLILALVVIAAIIFTNFMSFSKVQDFIDKSLVEKQVSETELAASQIEDNIHEVQMELIALSRTRDINMGNCSSKIETLASALLITDDKGEVVDCSNKKYENYKGISIRNKDYFNIARESREAYVSGLVRQGSSNQVIITVPRFTSESTRTMFNATADSKGKFLGVVMAIVDVEDLFLRYIHPIISTRGYFIIIKKGTINRIASETIMKSDAIPEYEAIKKDIELAGDRNIFVVDGFGKTIISKSDIAVGSERWQLITLTPTENLNPQIKSIQNRHIAGLASVLVLIIAVFIVMISLLQSKEDIRKKLEKANITLEKLGISVKLENKRYADTDILLKPHNVYLVSEEEEQAYELFLGTLNRGFAGLGVIRENPERIKKRYSLQNTPLIWLSKEKIAGAPSETDMENLVSLIKEFVKKSKRSVILINRVDYLVDENGFKKVLKAIHSLRDISTTNNAIIILALRKGVLEDREYNALAEDMIDLLGAETKMGVELSDNELEILKFVNERNANNKLVSFRDITTHLKITKPTTRVRISRLQSLGLLNIEYRGRIKSVRITSSGRRFI